MATVNMVCIGDELLDGRTREGNGFWLGGWLRRAGHRLVSVTLVADDRANIVAALRRAADGAALVVVSGGLGPTLDDITRDAVADLLGDRLIADAGSEARLRAKFARFGLPMPDNNLRQTLFPASARVVPNPVGTADCFVATFDGLPILVLPGVPREFETVAELELPVLLPATVPRRFITRRTAGIGESDLARRMEAVPCPDGIHVTWCASHPYVEVELSAAAEDDQALNDYASEALAPLAPWLLPVDEAGGALSAAAATLAALRAQGLRIATAESCTGGGIAKALTEVAGSSDGFACGVVTYSNRSKSELLGVDAALVQAEGAVSSAVAGAMAEGARARLGVQVAVAVTGVAGPGGGSDAKPVGTVYVAVSSAASGWVMKLSLGRSRSRRQIRETSTVAALRLVERLLAGRPEELEHFGGVASLRCYRSGTFG
jgi:nicotinamide-nucleotide amidase